MIWVKISFQNQNFAYLWTNGPQNDYSEKEKELIESQDIWVQYDGFILDL
jgi:hypothetical protein